MSLARSPPSSTNTTQHSDSLMKASSASLTGGAKQEEEEDDKNDETQTSKRKHSESINPVLLDMMKLNSKETVTKASSLSDLSSNENQNKQQIVRSKARKKVRIEGSGSVGNLRLPDIGKLNRVFVSEESKDRPSEYPSPHTSNSARLVSHESFSSLIADQMLREMTPGKFKVREDSEKHQKSSASGRKRGKGSEFLSKHTRDENYRQRVLLALYEKFESKDGLNKASVAKILTTFDDGSSLSDISKFISDFDFIQTRLQQEKQPITHEPISLPKETKRSLQRREISSEAVNIFERELPKALRIKINEMKNNPRFLLRMEGEKFHHRKRNKKDISAEAVASVETVPKLAQHSEEGEDVPFIGRLKNPNLTIILTELLKKQNTLQFFDPNTKTKFNEFLNSQRPKFWLSVVKITNFLETASNALQNYRNDTILKKKDARFSENIYVAKMKWRINRKKIAAEIIRRSFICFLDTKLVYKAMQKLRANMYTCREMIRSYIEIRKARIQLLMLQFEKYEKIRNSQAVSTIARGIVKTKSQSKILLTTDMKKEVLKITDSTSLAPTPQLYRTPSRQKLRVDDEQQQPKEEKKNESLIPPHIRLKLITEEYITRRQKFLTSVYQSKKKHWFKCLFESSKMYELIARAHKTTSDLITKRRGSFYDLTITE